MLQLAIFSSVILSVYVIVGCLPKKEKKSSSSTRTVATQTESLPSAKPLFGSNEQQKNDEKPPPKPEEIKNPVVTKCVCQGIFEPKSEDDDTLDQVSSLSADSKKSLKTLNKIKKVKKERKKKRKNKQKALNMQRQRSPSLKLNPTQMDSIKETVKKESSARRHRDQLKPGEVNEHSDDTGEDAPSLPLKVGKSYTEKSTRRPKSNASAVPSRTSKKKKKIKSDEKIAKPPQMDKAA